MKKTMKTVCNLATCLAFFAISAEAVEIPRQFHGTWGATPESCNLPDDSPIDFPDTGAKIDANGIEQYELGYELKSIKSSSKTAFTAVYVMHSPDGDETETITLRLMPDGRLKGLGDAIVRCPKHRWRK